MFKMDFNENVEITINGEHIEGDYVTYDGCHKIYIATGIDELEYMEELGYEAYPMSYLPEIYKNSCSLRFISNATLTEQYVPQFTDDIVIEVTLLD